MTRCVLLAVGISAGIGWWFAGTGLWHLACSVLVGAGVFGGFMPARSRTAKQA